MVSSKLSYDKLAILDTFVQCGRKWYIGDGCIRCPSKVSAFKIACLGQIEICCKKQRKRQTKFLVIEYKKRHINQRS